MLFCGQQRLIFLQLGYLCLIPSRRLLGLLKSSISLCNDVLCKCVLDVVDVNPVEDIDADHGERGGDEGANDEEDDEVEDAHFG